MSDAIDVGTPPTRVQRWKTAVVCFHGFTNLTTERGEEIESPSFLCLGEHWTLDVFPGGAEGASDGMVSVFLWNMTDGSTDFDTYLIVRNSAGEGLAYCQPTGGMHSTNSDTPRSDINQCWGKLELAKRSTLIDALVDGTLIIEVGTRKHVPTNFTTAPFIPANPLYKNILERFMDEESADVVFEVCVENGKGYRSGKRAKTISTNRFHAHRFVIEGSGSTLAELCKPGGGEANTIPIRDVKAGVFRLILYFFYGGKLSEEELKANAKDLIDAADRYGIVSLKLEAEASYAESIALTADNVLDHLLYAHSKNCALLKEAVMDFIVEHRDVIINEVSFDDVPGSLMKDLLAAVSRGARDKNGSNASHYNSLRVGTLRKMLDEKGLEVDGSREAMIALLKEHS